MNTADLEALVAPVAAAHTLEVDRLEVMTAGKRAVVRVFLDGDGPEGHGPSLDEIASATRDISATLDAADITKGKPYTLEVSSRGVSRPLTEAKHFRRNTRRLVALTLADGTVTGRIRGVTDDGIELDVDGEARTVPLAEVQRALVQVELNRPVAGEEYEEETEG
ncbi:MAG: ribosome maturation factor RimP [Propionicimonas sp.]|uniref:ribosome maturation factor RimP n=1 Tax=Propionicimonas sp. TaxID=1955623 RepID=UPI003D0AC6A8